METLLKSRFYEGGQRPYLGKYLPGTIANMKIWRTSEDTGVPVPEKGWHSGGPRIPVTSGCCDLGSGRPYPGKYLSGDDRKIWRTSKETGVPVPEKGWHSGGPRIPVTSGCCDLLHHPSERKMGDKGIW
ncbi:hypothetical protein CDAR_67851 [Caerostris darwini]|uniref:Uncharacterized protein n=1 Tax=Caerostris darwini TaxID=1538125 RepID=A0AAV4VST7_9ARAC|nr:hypothetical protein CDAR_67851 [Caerostris darwini]